MASDSTLKPCNGKQIYLSHYTSPIGGITLAGDGTALTGLWFDGQRFSCGTFQKQAEKTDLPIFDQTAEWLDIYFSGRDPGFTPALRIQTTPFRKIVADIMLTIPYGKTMTYREIANKVMEQNGMGRMSAQAVGGAVGHNPVALIIPCHRVVGSNGSLTGYGGGIRKKIYLLKLEGQDMTSFFVPKKGTAL